MCIISNFGNARAQESSLASSHDVIVLSAVGLVFSPLQAELGEEIQNSLHLATY